MAVSSQASLTEGHAQGIVPMRSFSIQYLSLILIILTFTIGVFAGHRVQADKRAVQAAAKPAMTSSTESTMLVESGTPIGRMSLDTLFELGTSEVNADSFEPLVQTLLAHDLEANFVVASPGDAVDSDSALAIALGRSAVLFRAFLDRGVPASAVQVLASDERDIPAVSVDFAKSAEGE